MKTHGLLAICLVTCSIFAADRRSIELKDYYAIENAVNTAISPDGNSVAFVRTRIIEAENRSQSEIWLVPSDGSHPARRLTSPAFSSSNPRWSPDGKLLAFTSRRKLPGVEEEVNTWFLRMDEQGGEAFQIPGVGAAPVFSPDNQWIAFTKKTPPETKPVKRELSEFEKLTEKRFKGRIYDWLSVRMDGQGYLPDRRDPNASPPSELYVVPGKGGVSRQLTKLGVNVRAVAWSPDSRRLAIVADSHERDEHSYERADLWIVDIDSNIRRLTDDGYEYSSPAWSPDGRSLAFLRSQSLNMVIQSKQNHGSAVDIYRMPIDGGRMENLTGDFDLIPVAPEWGPDGRQIYFTASKGGDAQLFRLSATGGKAEQLTRGGRSQTGFSLSAALDRMAFVAGDSTHPGDVYSARVTAQIGGSEERRLTGVNGELLARVELNGAQQIHYPSDDGTTIEGWVVLPTGYDPARGKYPMILNIHGGPHGAFSSGFAFSNQLLAARGYVVLYTNPRGSTGYGEKFLWATWGGWGVLDYQDVMAGVRYVQGKYAVDPKRMGVSGYSYGGYLTNWIITQTNQFAAAVAGAGVSNWTSDYGTADIPRTKESEFFGPPWEERSAELLRKASPITWVRRARTPTLFVHGESDMRVPIEQAEQMYTALKKQKVRAKFVRYPDTYHGGWTPWNTVHRSWQELQWWDEHLAAGTSEAAQN